MSYRSKRVMVFGTFDILHLGHLNFLKQAKKYGDYLIVVVGRDRTVEKVKGRLPKHNEKERVKQIEKTGLTDKVVLGYLKDHYKIIQEHKPDLICLGYDQNFFADGLPEALKKLELKIKIIRLKPYKPQIYKTSKLR